MSTAINIQHLSVQYNDFTVLEDISLQIPSQVRAGLVGPNGAGKSTLIKAILGLIPSQHQVLEIYSQKPDERTSTVAYIPQRSEVNWNFPTTVSDVVMMGITSKRWGWQRVTKEDKDKVNQALDRMGILTLKDRPINQLSGGQKQRVFLARSIAQDASLYLLDEPLTGVDVNSEKVIMNQLQAFQKAGKTSLTVHHNLASIEQYFDYLIVVNRKLIACGPTRQVLESSALEEAFSSTSHLSRRG